MFAEEGQDQTVERSGLFPEDRVPGIRYDSGFRVFDVRSEFVLQSRRGIEVSAPCQQQHRTLNRFEYGQGEPVLQRRRRLRIVTAVLLVFKPPLDANRVGSPKRYLPIASFR